MPPRLTLGLHDRRELPPYAQLLLALRTQRKWTQAQTAARLRVSRRQVQRWEGGLQEPLPLVVDGIRALLLDSPDLGRMVEASVAALTHMELAASCDELSAVELAALTTAIERAQAAVLASAARRRQPRRRSA